MGIETAALIGVGALGAGASYLGASEQAGAAENAANVSAQTGRESIAFQREMFNKLLELQQPYYNVGTGAIPAYMNYLGLSRPGGNQGATVPQSPPPVNNLIPNTGSTGATMGNYYIPGVTEIDPRVQGLQVGKTLDMGGGYQLRLNPDGTITAITSGDFNAMGGGGYSEQQINNPEAYWSLFQAPNRQKSPIQNALFQAINPDRAITGQGYPGELGNLPVRSDYVPRQDDQDSRYGPALNSPMYQWRLQEGTNALNNALRARGKYDSSAGLRAIGDLTNQLTGEETEKGYNRLLDAIKIGSGAAGSAGQGAISTGQGVAGTYGQMGNALAAGQMGAGNAWGQFYSGLGGLPMQLTAMNYLLKK